MKTKMFCNIIWIPRVGDSLNVYVMLSVIIFFCFSDIEQNGIDFTRQVRTNFASLIIHHVKTNCWYSEHLSWGETLWYGSSSGNGL